jgi:hypothetical protein
MTYAVVQKSTFVTTLILAVDRPQVVAVHPHLGAVPVVRQQRHLAFIS